MKTITTLIFCIGLLFAAQAEQVKKFYGRVTVNGSNVLVAVDAEDIMPGAVLEIHIGSDAVSQDKIQYGAVGTNQLDAEVNAILGGVYWIDLIVPGLALAPAVAAPALIDTGMGTGIKAMGYDLNDAAYGVLQMPHGLALTNAARTNLVVYPHVHWSLATAPSPATNNAVTWQMTWEWANCDGPYSRTGVLSATVTGTVATNAFLTDLGPITNDAAGISSVFRFKLNRISSLSNDYGATRVILDQFDMHVPIDRPGSVNVLSQ